MKKTLLLIALVITASLSMAQTIQQRLEATRMTPQQQLNLVQKMNSKSNYQYRLDNYYADDEYEIFNYFYNANHQLIALESMSGWEGLMDYVHVYDSLSYDDAGDLVRDDSWQWINNIWKHVSYCDYTYNNHLIATRTNYNFFGGEWAMGGIYYYTYNEQGQLIQSKLWFMNEWFDQTTYTYDAQGRLSGSLYSYDHYMNGDLMSYDRQTYTYDANGLLTLILNEECDIETGIWSITKREFFSYDANGNCTTYESKTAGGSSIEKKVYEYETRLLSETFIPHTPEFDNPLLYQNHNTYHTMHYYRVDDNFDLQYLCDYLYNYCGYNSISNAETLSLSLYPNPATDHLTIQAQEGDNLMSIYSLDGKCVKVQRMNGTDLHVDLSSLSKGTYLVRVQGRQVRTAKVVVR